MKKPQWIAILIGLSFTAIIYLSFDLKPSKYEVIELNRKMSFTETDITSLLKEARSSISNFERISLDQLNKDLGTSNDSTNIEVLESIASKWFQLGYPEISGHYAAEIARIDDNSDAWGIAGTTFAIGLQRNKNELVSSFAFNSGIDAFDRAISLDPDNVNHRLNKALLYTDRPPEENPMKGIKMILALNKEFPEHIGTLNQLGRLGVRTKQYKKAVQRLEKVLSLQPNNKNAICLLAVAYKGLEEIDKAEAYQEKCASLNK